MRRLTLGFLTIAALAPLARAQTAAPSVDKLITMIERDESNKVRLQAAVYLGRSGDERAAKALIAALTNDSDYTVRAASAMALANLKASSGIAAILYHQASDTNAFVREESARALGKFQRADAVPYVIATAGSSDAGTRLAALKYLTTAPTAGIDGVLTKALGDEDAKIVALAQETLQKGPPAEATRLLEGAISHPEPSVRRGAVELLHRLDSADATQLVLRVYARDIEEEDVRLAARKALRDLKRHLPMADIIRDATTSPEKHVRAPALLLLGVVGGDEAKRVLIEALNHEDQYVRGNAVMALAELGDKSALPVLEKLAEDPANHRIATMVRRAVQQLKRKADPS